MTLFSVRRGVAESCATRWTILSVAIFIIRPWFAAGSFKSRFQPAARAQHLPRDSGVNWRWSLERTTQIGWSSWAKSARSFWAANLIRIIASSSYIHWRVGMRSKPDDQKARTKGRNFMSGKVYLVGAGPGDPDLLTLKALKILKLADVVLHDDLIPRQILDLVPRTAQLRNVGQRCGQKSISQDEIYALLVTFASFGLQVVRLKGGDPLIFGRGGEEIEALRKARIDVEIVPGITAALG